MKTKKKCVSIVAPFYNEGESVCQFWRVLGQIVDSMPAYDFEIVCVDDGSSDDTLQKLLSIAVLEPRFRVIEFSRNFGKEAALTAALDAAVGDALIPIDADLQDPPELIPVMIAHWEDGAEVVLARRVDRRADSYLKRKTAELFYRFHNRVSDTRIPENVGDFRLMDRTVVDAIKRLPERQRFMKGLFAWVGFKTVAVDYTRGARGTGATKFSAWKLWNLALDGITSFSTMPLKLMSYLGALGTLGTLATLFYALYIVGRTLLHGVDVPGYASLLVAVLLVGSLQLLGLGILGEYIGRIYIETKQRPNYVVRKDHGLCSERSR